MRYTRELPGDASPEALADAEAHVRAHLSAVASEDDDPETNADDVTVHVERQGGTIMVVGELDAEPVAPYLAADFDPERDVQDNPLTVASITEGAGR